MKKLNVSLMSFILIFLFISFTIAQGYQFRVMATNGTVKVKTGNSWEQGKIGIKVDTKDQIKLSKNSYVSLIHKSGQTLELKESGVYKVSDLAKQVSGKKSSVASKFADYLIDEISNSDDLLAEGEYKDNMNITGSVTRAIDQPFLKKDALLLNSPRKVNLLSNVFTFRWQAKPDVKSYKFILTDRFDRPVFSKEVNATSLTINAEELNLDKNAYYFWKVKAKGNDKSTSEDACFLILSDDKVKAIQDTVKELKQELGNENTPTAKIILAAFYEQKYLVDEALRNYRDAVKLAPEVEFYQKLYQRFLNRIQVTEK